jgi:hypothetical protein
MSWMKTSRNRVSRNSVMIHVYFIQENKNNKIGNFGRKLEMETKNQMWIL